MDYDEDRIYYSYQNLQTQDENDSTTANLAKDLEMDAENVDSNIIRRHFREFLSKFPAGKRCFEAMLSE